MLSTVPQIPTFFAAHRGSGPIGFSGETVWSMPGGFTTGNQAGYQTLDEDVEARPPPPSRSAGPQPPTTT
ncbi:hypothetical protein Clacol_003695 [Clathrus columnatus]|uniref:Uncharacterized protein n=1 Tax=Clathrus columnatus TaxID=1419009 RepID=A0AAV5A733_9AGAM|nr:hypothetical protein Clacol_003695 [Clathrus columnatus]